MSFNVGDRVRIAEDGWAGTQTGTVVSLTSRELGSRYIEVEFDGEPVLPMLPSELEAE